MINFEFLVCSESVIRDAEKDTFSAINILEDFVAETYPTFIPKLSVLLTATREQADESTYTVKFSIIINEATFYSGDFPLPFADKLKTNLALNLAQFPIDKPGRLTFRFEYQDRNISYSINMKQRPKPATATPGQQ